MKIRLILLILAGILIYIFLANYHSNMVKEISKTKEQAAPVHMQEPVPASPSVEEKKAGPPAISQTPPAPPAPQEKDVPASPEQPAGDQTSQSGLAISDKPTVTAIPALRHLKSKSCRQTLNSVRLKSAGCATLRRTWPVSIRHS